jgi:hypothetical protein
VYGVVVPYPVASTGRVEVLTEHKSAGFLEPHLLLELQGAHRGDGLEVMVEILLSLTIIRKRGYWTLERIFKLL